MTTVFQALTVTRELIADPARWTKGYFARDTAGSEVYPTESNAVCWCADGALAKSADVTIDAESGEWSWDTAGVYEAASKLLRSVTKELTGQTSYSRVNDGNVEIEDKSPHEAILFVLDTALERFEKES
ncbi:DUF6197 family protein [Bradyrhizobium ottawaense]|uniref:DUF2591 domain-containing protein n=1 Tax=Bradyrhizobium ottawaense TaxID=931866 RepID=A0ABY0QHA3_9BRAD|nr:hypothetical protein [Bradyrhizobium ottawaense]SDK43098.1 hypothetical protein SAMN05444163_8094 [Bradyrhizobium ottawaense]